MSCHSGGCSTESTLMISSRFPWWRCVSYVYRVSMTMALLYHVCRRFCSAEPKLNFLNSDDQNQRYWQFCRAYDFDNPLSQSATCCHGKHALASIRFCVVLSVQVSWPYPGCHRNTDQWSGHHERHLSTPGSQTSGLDMHQTWITDQQSGHYHDYDMH